MRSISSFAIKLCLRNTSVDFESLCLSYICNQQQNHQNSTSHPKTYINGIDYFVNYPLNCFCLRFQFRTNRRTHPSEGQSTINLLSLPFRFRSYYQLQLLHFSGSPPFRAPVARGFMTYCICCEI